MSEVVLLVTLTARPGKEAEGEDFLKALLEPTHREDGCLLYAIHRGVEDPLQMAFVERWESRELLEKHRASDHIQTALVEVGEFFSDGPVITIYEALPGGDADKGSIAGHAASERVAEHAE
jgi:quinol monooxygenase YgiN